jgi:hypothetical protein
MSAFASFEFDDEFDNDDGRSYSPAFDFVNDNDFDVNPSKETEVERLVEDDVNRSGDVGPLLMRSGRGPRSSPTKTSASLENNASPGSFIDPSIAALPTATDSAASQAPETTTVSAVASVTPPHARTSGGARLRRTRIPQAPRVITSLNTTSMGDGPNLTSPKIPDARRVAAKSRWKPTDAFDIEGWEDTASAARSGVAYPEVLEKKIQNTEKNSTAAIAFANEVVEHDAHRATASIEVPAEAQADHSTQSPAQVAADEAFERTQNDLRAQILTLERARDVADGKRCAADARRSTEMLSAASQLAARQIAVRQAQIERLAEMVRMAGLACDLNVEAPNQNVVNDKLGSGAVNAAATLDARLTSPGRGSARTDTAGGVEGPRAVDLGARGAASEPGKRIPPVGTAWDPAKALSLYREAARSVDFMWHHSFPDAAALRPSTAPAAAARALDAAAHIESAVRAASVTEAPGGASASRAARRKRPASAAAHARSKLATADRGGKAEQTAGPRRGAAGKSRARARLRALNQGPMKPPQP